MTKKIAFFVEGFTEQYFIKKLVESSYDTRKISIQTSKVKGGSKVPISFTSISLSLAKSNEEFYILIYDCGGESNIRSYIDEQRMTLAKSGYSKIIGIRDLFPQFRREDLLNLLNGLKYRLPQKEIEVDFIISIMEIEALFLAEANHFSKIHVELTIEKIRENLGFCPINENMEFRDFPAIDLDNCYKLIGDSYLKEKLGIQRTIDLLDFPKIYFDLRAKYSGLGKLLQELDMFFEN